MSRIVRLAFVAACLKTSSAAFAGWGAGGGMLPTDDINPWFINNTKVATYCIEMDEVHFGQTLAASRDIIQKSLRFWANDFAAVNPIHIEGDAQMSIATQQFIETDCSQNVDIRFQLGTLSLQQRQAFIPVPEETAAIAIRTSYDSENLRGKGFIYVSPETGPLALTSVSGLGTPIVKDRWQMSDGKLLEITLVHELGHVFGLTHNFNRWLMKSDAVSKALAGLPLGIFPIQSRLRFGAKPFRAKVSPSELHGLGVSGKYDEIQVRRSEQPNSLSIFLSGQDGQIEAATITNVDNYPSAVDETVPRLLLTQRQNVFSIEIPKSGKLISSKVDSTLSMSAKITPKMPGFRSFSAWLEVTHAGFMKFTMPDNNGAVRRNLFELSDD